VFGIISLVSGLIILLFARYKKLLDILVDMQSVEELACEGRGANLVVGKLARVDYDPSVNTVSRPISSEEMIDYTRIMAELRQAVLVFGKNLAVENSISDYAKTLFGNEILDHSALDLLFGNTDLSEADKNGAAFQLSGAFGMAKIQWKISLLALPKEARLRTEKKHIIVRYSYFPRFDSKGLLQRVVVVVEDISDLKKTRDEVVRRHKEMEKIFSLIEVPDAIFSQYMEETSATFSRIKNDLKLLRTRSDQDPVEIIEHMLRDVHTIKGNSRMFNFDHIYVVASDLEGFLARCLQDSNSFSSSAVSKLTAKVMEINEEIYSYTSLRRDVLDRGEKVHEQLTEYRTQWIKSLIHIFTSYLRSANSDDEMLGIIQLDLNRAIDSLSRVSMMDYLHRYDGMVSELGANLGKKLKFNFNDIEFQFFDSSSLTVLNTSLIHILRNCVDHGLETSEERLELGKSEYGNIGVSITMKDHWITINIWDDGRGVDWESIALKALSSGLISRDRYELMSKSEKENLIFAPGISTKLEVTDLSGRGVGMDAVRASIQKAGGKIEVEATKGEGSRFIINLPERFEDFLSSMAVFDWQELIESAWYSLNGATAERGIDLVIEQCDPGPYFLLGEKEQFIKAFASLFRELCSHCEVGGKISCGFTRNMGRREQDSYEFFQTYIKFPVDLENGFGFEALTSVHKVRKLLTKHSGSLCIRSRSEVEVSIPTSMPYPFGSTPLNIYLCGSEELSETLPWIKEVLSSKFFNWQYKVTGDLADFANVEDKDIFVISSPEGLRDYFSTRGGQHLIGDSFLIICGGGDLLGIEGMAKIPPNSMLMPRPLRRSTFCKMFESLIFRGFINEIRYLENPSSNPLQDLKRPA